MKIGKKPDSYARPIYCFCCSHYFEGLCKKHNFTMCLGEAIRYTCDDALEGSEW